MSSPANQHEKKTGSRFSAIKKIALLLSILFGLGLNNSHAQNTWAQKTDFGGSARWGAVGFSIGSKGYFGTGRGNDYYKDFWEYDPATNTWTQKSDFGGDARYLAVGLNIGSKGYLGMGYNDNNGDMADLWEYDPATNTWARKADFVGVVRRNAVSFSIGNKGYYGTGRGTYFYKDFWEYDPAVDTWTQKADFGGTVRQSAAGFSIGSKGYIGTGQFYDGDDYDYNDFWEYDPATNAWTQKADFAGSARSSATCFTISGKGYVGTGYIDYNNHELKDFWEYDPSTNTWTQKADFGGAARTSAAGFSIGSKGYIGTGGDYPTFYKDFWEYTPSSATACASPSDLKVPSISDTAAVLKWTLPADSVNGFDILYHIIGSTPVHKRHTGGSTNHIAIGNLLPGTIYRWKIRSDCTTDTTKWINGPDFTSTSLLGPVAKANVYPNPARNIVTVNYTAYDAGKYFFEITDISGNVLLHKEANAIPGTNSIALDVSSLFKGAYFINIINPDKTRERMQLSIE
jgi:N-acetylneuraminic acid mutarotase